MFCCAISILIATVINPYFDKGAYLSVATAVFPLFGVANGYSAARFYTFFNGTSWKMLAVFTAAALPMFLSSCLIMIDMCEWIESGRADTLPLRDALLIGLYQYLIHRPTCFAGTYLGFL